jgi:hypothetical protein
MKEIEQFVAIFDGVKNDGVYFEAIPVIQGRLI